MSSFSLLVSDVEYYMQKALVQARKALSEEEVPVGCVFVKNNEIIAEGHNLTNQTKDPLAHAELVCIRKFQSSTQELLYSNVYLTCEPCIMCYGILKRLKCKIFFACFNPTFGCSIIHETKNDYYHNQEAIDLLKQFYKMENMNAPLEKRKIKNKK